jgi:RNA polymerase sigma-70 factor, ECF subfamily
MVAPKAQPPPVIRLERMAGVDGDAGPLELEAVFRQYAPYVARIGHRLLGRGDEVDDLVQDTFLAAHRGLGKLREREAIKGWLATVAVRLARRRLRRRRFWGAFGMDGAPDYHEIVEEGASPEERALVARVYRALDRLPVEQRMAWTLRHVEGESLERVAELTGCSLATAKRRIKAAQDHLKQDTLEEVPQ